MLLESLFSVIAEAVFGYLLQESGLAEQARAVLGLDPQRRAFQTALARAYTAFARHYPEWTASLFDEAFLKSEAVVPLLAGLLTRRGRPDPAQLARQLAIHLGHSDPDRWERLDEATRAAADFLNWLEAELANQPALQPLYDSRALERIAEHTEAIRRALEEEWPKALAEARNARPRADLERLRAARRYNIPPLPEHYIPREEYLAPLRRALLSDGAPALGIVGILGMGGIGKSVLAAALAHDPQVQAAFPDGIVWLPIGRQPNLPARQEELYFFLTGQRENFRDEIQGRGFLASALAGKACLVILDDVWDARHAEAFPLRASPSARYLLTTRNAEVLQTLNAQAFSLDVLTPEQALALLADWAGQPVDSLPAEARAVARECGYLPLALAMVGAFVRQNP
ncbi:NB-ARC domain-containing protein, partial [Thermoflexus sp.]|uniref:NB-ARC domain-containing protein n=1 Tax=Thermoflexus sp. TaxID=1969742 RepID=UPI00261ADCA5